MIIPNNLLNNNMGISDPWLTTLNAFIASADIMDTISWLKYMETIVVKETVAI
jgi:hypothetical protein